MSRSGRMAILLVGLGVGVATSVANHRGAPAVDAPSAWLAEALALAIGWSFIGSGVVAWSRRPRNRTEPLMILVGFLWLVGRLDFAADPLLRPAYCLRRTPKTPTSADDAADRGP